MIYLIMYDITDNNLRTKIAKKLIKEGAERIQFSVFVTHIDPLKNNLYKQMSNLLINDAEAKLFIIPVLKRNFYRTKIIGKFEEEVAYLAGDKSSLII